MMFSDFNNNVLDVIYNGLLSYFKNNVEFQNNDIALYRKYWKYDKIGRVIYNNIHFADGEGDFEISITLNKTFVNYIIRSENGKSITVATASKNKTIGGVIDHLFQDAINIETEIMNNLDYLI